MQTLKKQLISFIMLVSLTLILPKPIFAQPPISDVLFQVSTIGALAQGDYDGDYTYRQLAQHGDFGVGTFNHLDGEMVAIDGRFYQIPGDGKLRNVDPHELTPFAQVTFFHPVERFFLPINSFDAFKTTFIKNLKNPNIPYAIRIDGKFSQLTLRSVGPQHKPYPSLTTAAKGQKIFTLKEVTGTMVGFGFPIIGRALE
jgi:acetolactate decarboxylase